MPRAADSNNSSDEGRVQQQRDRAKSPMRIPRSAVRQVLAPQTPDPEAHLPKECHRIETDSQLALHLVRPRTASPFKRRSVTVLPADALLGKHPPHGPFLAARPPRYLDAYMAELNCSSVVEPSGAPQPTKPACLNVQPVQQALSQEEGQTKPEDPDISAEPIVRAAEEVREKMIENAAPTSTRTETVGPTSTPTITRTTPTSVQTGHNNDLWRKYLNIDDKARTPQLYENSAGPYSIATQAALIPQDRMWLKPQVHENVSMATHAAIIPQDNAWRQYL